MIVNNVVNGGPALTIPAHFSFAQHAIDKLREICDADENAISLINGDSGEKITYKQILQETVNIAVGLKRLGVKRGDVVALCSENRAEYVPVALGAICCGATITTLNIMYTKDEMTHVLSISRPTLMFCSEAALQLNLTTIKAVPCIKRIIQMNGSPVERGILPFSEVNVPANVREYEPEEVQGSDTVFLLYSSGTTGLPKGVMLSHLNALYSLSSFEYEIDKNATGTESLLTIVPWYHAYGLMSTVNYLLVKKLLVYLAGFNPEVYLRNIQEHKINVLLAVPPIVVFLAKHPLVAKFDLSSITSVWCGAAPLSSDIIQQTLKRLPNCNGVFQAYGMTETSLTATKDYADDSAPRKPGSGGYPLRGVKAKVVDIETRKKLGPNEKGEICLKGPILMKGYAGDVAASRAMIDDEGYLKTGDIGYYDEEGCFFIVDRLKELIKYKGNQVPPALVESVLLQHSGVAECGVAGAPDEAAGELPTAFVVPKPGAKLTERELLQFTDDRLSQSTRLHGGIIFVKEIPKNPSGKILRRMLKQLLLDRSKKSKL